MSRTRRHASYRPYSCSAPTPEHEKRDNRYPGSKHYRRRYFHGYDGARMGKSTNYVQVSDGIALQGYHDRFAGPKRKRFSKKKVARATRLMARRFLQDTCALLEE
jgi:hypothetical protein